MEEEVEAGTVQLFLAGQVVQPGFYRERVERRNRDKIREIILNEPDYLPASIDGKVATYIKVEPFGLKQAT